MDQAELLLNAYVKFLFALAVVTIIWVFASPLASTKIDPFSWFERHRSYM